MRALRARAQSKNDASRTWSPADGRALRLTRPSSSPDSHHRLTALPSQPTIFLCVCLLPRRCLTLCSLRDRTLTLPLDAYLRLAVTHAHMLSLPLPRLLAAVLGLSLLLPQITAQTTCTGPTCGDVLQGTCPGEAFPGSAFTGIACGNSEHQLPRSPLAAKPSAAG